MPHRGRTHRRTIAAVLHRESRAGPPSRSRRRTRFPRADGFRRSRPRHPHLRARLTPLLQHGKVFPTPGLAPKKTLSFPRAARASESRTCARRQVGVRATISHLRHGVRRQAVQRKVEPEDVDPGFAQEAQLPTLGVLGDQLADPVRREGPRPCHSAHLVVCRGRRDVRIQPAARAGDQGRSAPGPLRLRRPRGEPRLDP